jgi:hypothetical protein
MRVKVRRTKAWPKAPLNCVGNRPIERGPTVPSMYGDEQVRQLRQNFYDFKHNYEDMNLQVFDYGHGSLTLCPSARLSDILERLTNQDDLLRLRHY